MVRNVIFLFLGVFLFNSQLNAQVTEDPPDWGNDCILRGGQIGKFVHSEDCEDDFEIVSRFGTPSKPIMSGILICCRKCSPHTAKYLCKKLVGKRRDIVKPQILAGMSVSQGEFPHMAAIGYMLPGRPPVLSFQCGGTLISDRFVLTAGHCILNKEGIRPYLVRLGILNKFPTDDEPYDTALTDYLVVENITHPEYHRTKRYNDIALLRLDRPVKSFTLTIFPACLDHNKVDPQVIMSVAGWGINKKKGGTDDTSDVLLKAYMEATTAEDCRPFYNKGSWAKNYPNGIPANQMCAMGAKNNTDADTCRGDSGGPLQLQIEDLSLSRVVGVTSFGPDCGNKVPGIYVRVSMYLDWILETVWPDKDYAFAES